MDHLRPAGVVDGGRPDRVLCRTADAGATDAAAGVLGVRVHDRSAGPGADSRNRHGSQRISRLVRRRGPFHAALRAGQDRVRDVGSAPAGGPPDGAGVAAGDADPAGAGRGHCARADRRAARPRADGVAGHHPAGAAVVRGSAAAGVPVLAVRGRRVRGRARLAEGYRSDRVRSWLNPGADPQDIGYQARQARYALANGGVFGDGLGQGTAKWNYLPNAHNDFIFAIIGEELGFVGAGGLSACSGCSPTPACASPGARPTRSCGC